ncbi:hypothetical protein EJ04DRAFT_111162 [Polyplosphaeria fusca]|uniref:Uncharacterized protein n=1 Tax=Polyplosphaeria fusca TaxID=682080 RepID=A0A9P4RCH1_9PLEO|nr:hypothetical protein EJ04DRAFT_111162 [Polyplosphaeria fusca]
MPTRPLARTAAPVFAFVIRQPMEKPQSLQILNKCLQTEAKDSSLQVHFNPTDIRHIDDLQNSSEKRDNNLIRAQQLTRYFEDYQKALQMLICPTITMASFMEIIQSLFTAAHRRKKHLPALLNMLDRICEVLPRYSIYLPFLRLCGPLREKIRASNNQLALFILELKRFFEMSYIRMLVADWWKSFEERFESQVVELRRYWREVEDQARSGLSAI